MVFWEHDLTVLGQEARLPQRGDVRPLLLSQRKPFRAPNNTRLWIILSWLLSSGETNRILPLILMVFVLAAWTHSLCPFSYYKHYFCSPSIPMQSSLPLPFLLLLYSLCFPSTGLSQQFVLNSCIKWHGIHIFFMFSRCKWQQHRLESPLALAGRAIQNVLPQQT